ncbi:hypothetical protein C8J57DRAFT_1230459 [Mycena rebaudengoi]|nr:hypothetical protein C8J57DRAFT_1230459 [Mycena rebaudengoi]
MLKLVQINSWKSRNPLEILVGSNNFDIICTQEPNINKTIHASKNPGYALIFPEFSETHRVSVYVKLSSIPVSSICPCPDLSSSGDIMVIDFTFGSVKLYKCIVNRPDNADTPEVRQTKERQVAQSLFQYLSCTGAFQNWVDAQDDYEGMMSKDPIGVWRALSGSTPELANFAILVLKAVLNQADCGRVFSDLKNKETPHRNQLGIEKLDTHADHLEKWNNPQRHKRQNHASIDKLLVIPRYCDLLDDQGDEDPSERGRTLVQTKAGWRTELAKWIAEVRQEEAEAAETDEDESDDDTEPAPANMRLPKTKKWAKTTLTVLFGDVVKKPVTKFSAAEMDKEAVLMGARRLRMRGWMMGQ